MKKKKRQKIRPYQIAKEDKWALRLFDSEDRRFITETLRGLRNHEIDPVDYSPNAEMPEKVFIKPKFSMPEETIETLMPPAPVKEEIKETVPLITVTPRVDRRAFMENEFTIVDKDNKEVPFRLRYRDSFGEHSVQEKYYNMLMSDYPNNIDRTIPPKVYPIIINHHGYISISSNYSHLPYRFR